MILESQHQTFRRIPMRFPEYFMPYWFSNFA